MRTSRVQPPPLVEREHVLRCPLDLQAVHEHRYPGSAAPWYSCPDCQAYWSPSDVRDGRPGRWDDSGVACTAVAVRIGDGGEPVVLDCVLGDDHAAGADPAVHVSADLVSWWEVAHERLAA